MHNEKVTENYLDIKNTYLAEHDLKGPNGVEIAVRGGKFVEEDGLTVLDAFKKSSHH